MTPWVGHLGGMLYYASMSKFLYAGLDGEMSSNDLSAGGRLIQIGFAIGKPFGTGVHVFNQNINPGEMDWQEEAADAHKITREEIATFDDPYTADTKCYKFLVDNGADPKRRAKTIPVGFNVGAFDMPFVKQLLPKTYSLFSRQTVDLNALCFAFGEIRKNEAGEPVGMGAMKDAAKTYADHVVSKLGSGDDWRKHNAAYDAAQAYYCFEFLKIS